MKASRVQEILDVLSATFDDDADYDDPWVRVMWAGLMVARQSAVGARYKRKPTETGLDVIREAYARAEREDPS